MNLKHKGINFKGDSVAGIKTSIFIPEISLCFETTQKLSYILNSNHFFISHGHIDHCADIPYIIAMKAFHHQNQPFFYVPAEICEQWKKIVKLWTEIQSYDYQFNIVPVKTDSFYELNDFYVVKVFKTTHIIPSYGYSVFRRKKKLKKEYLNLSANEILNLKKKQIIIEEEILEPFITYSGDTTIDFLNNNNWWKRSKFFFVEITNLDDRKSVFNTKKWGHIHLDEFIPYIEEFKGELLIFTHISARYSLSDIGYILTEKIPIEFQPKVRFFR